MALLPHDRWGKLGCVLDANHSNTDWEQSLKPGTIIIEIYIVNVAQS